MKNGVGKLCRWRHGGLLVLLGMILISSFLVLGHPAMRLTCQSTARNQPKIGLFKNTFQWADMQTDMCISVLANSDYGQDVGGINPVITGMSLPQRVVRIMDSVAMWELYFNHSDGNISWIKFEEYDGSGWVDSGQFDPDVYGVVSGEIKVVTQCMELAVALARVTLLDTYNLESTPYYFVLDCQRASGLASSNTVETNSHPVQTHMDSVPVPQGSYHTQIQQNRAQIRFIVSDGVPGKATLSIFDLSGKRVFASAFVVPGLFSWNTVDALGLPVPNGVYLYTLSNLQGNSTQRTVRRLVVMR